MKAMVEEEDAPEIPLTSLIDVVFLLLVFFLVATRFVPKEVDHEVRLPVSDGGGTGTVEPRNLVINIRADGSTVVDGALVPPEGLRGCVAAWRAEHPDRRVTLRGDADVNFQAVMRVFGVCRAEGVTQIEMPVLDPAASSGGSA